MDKCFDIRPTTSNFDLKVTFDEIDDVVSEPYAQELTTQKSTKTYNKWFERYEKYARDRTLSKEDVTTFMNWICHLKNNENFMATTITTAASCVSSRLKLKSHKNLMSHVLVKELIKKINKEHVPKQAPVFTREQIDQFLLRSPETQENQTIKLAAIIGINCGLRISELACLEEEDITILPNGTASVLLKKSKTDPAGKGHTFIITSNPNPKLCGVTRLQNNLNMEKTSGGISSRLFRKISPMGKKTVIPIGINKMGAMPKTIATFLKLPNSSDFSGHSFRRTSATLLGEKGMGLMELKQHGRWRSSAVAERYCENTTAQKTRTSNMIQNLSSQSTATKNNQHHFSNCTFNNCTIQVLKN